MGKGYKYTKQEKEEIKIARATPNSSNIVHYYRWIKSKLLEDCRKNECGTGRAFRGEL